jgi:hypothetical protein
MVDFNNETTVATPPGEVVKIVVLERREQVIEALENYHRIHRANVDTGDKLHLLHARVMALWYQLQAMVKRRLKGAKGTPHEPDYEMVKQAITGAEEESELIEAYEWMNEFIDKMGLTFIDSRANYDRTNVEDANQKKGM